MLVSDLISAVRTSLGDGGGVFAKDDFIIGWMNEAIRDIFRKAPVGRDHRFVQTLNGGTSQLTFTDEIYKVHYIACEEVKLEETLFETLLDQYGWEYVNSQETPRFFWRGYDSGATVINFAPTPPANVDLTMSVTYLPDELTISDDTTDVLPSSYVDDIIRFCVMRGHERGKDFRASEKAEQQYNNNIGERISEATKIDDDYQVMTPDPYDYI